MLLAIAIWLGALIFFPVVAQISFTALPSPHLAGLVVRNSLIALHWMGMGAGIVFLACSLAENRFAHGHFSSLRSSHSLVIVMFALTAISQFKIIPEMDVLRMRAGEISQLSGVDPVRRQFDSRPRDECHSRPPPRAYQSCLPNRGPLAQQNGQPTQQRHRSRRCIHRARRKTHRDRHNRHAAADR